MGGGVLPLADRTDSHQGRSISFAASWSSGMAKDRKTRPLCSTSNRGRFKLTTTNRSEEPA